MTNLRFSIANFITVNLMVAIVFVVIGLAKSAVSGGTTMADNG